MNGLNDAAELQVIFAAVDSFFQYRKNAHFNTTHRRRQNFYALPTAQWQMLAEAPFNFLETLNAIDDAIDCNADLADEIVSRALSTFELPQTPDKASPSYWQQTAKPNDMAKAHSTLRQFYRDWSVEGFRTEVKPLLDLVLTDLETYITKSIEAPQPPDVLLPGAGLGRLLFELCLAGYNTTGNEISYHQLLTSNLVLNHMQRAGQHTIYPFATTFTNNLNRANQLKAFQIPDIHPGTAMATAISSGRVTGEMNMTAGDFVLAYSDPDSTSTFDAVVSVFFIDTAPNLIRYIETVHNCLRPGGVWINIGPLLWHFDDRIQQAYQDNHNNDKRNATLATTTTIDNTDAMMGVDNDEEAKADEEEDNNNDNVNENENENVNEDTGIAEPGSFELTNDEVILLLEKTGFIIEKQEILTTPPTPSPPPSSAPGSGSTGYGYIQDPDSMLQSTYRCSHWVARRV